MSEQLKQELEADISRLETETVADSETIGKQEKDAVEGKLEAQEGNESKEEDTVPMGKASLADIVSGIPAPTKEEVEAAEVENAKPVKQKAKEKLEAEKKKATQKNFADPVITYLLKRCEEDQGLAEDVMQEEKTWNKCFNYTVEQARKQSNGRNTAVKDQVVYEWAEDYYHKKEEKPAPTKKAGGKKTSDKKHVTAKNAVLSTKKANKKAVKKDVANKQQKKGKTNAKSSELSGQMSLFDLL